MSMPPKDAGKGKKEQFQDTLYYREITRGPRKGTLVRKTRSEVWKARLELEKQENLEREAKAHAAWEAGKEVREARQKKASSISTKLWAWGVYSERYPTRSIGVFPSIIMWLVIVPILAVLYKLSFTILAPLLFLGAGIIFLIFEKIKRYF